MKTCAANSSSTFNYGRTRSRRAFSLVEMIVAMSIFGTVMAITMGSYLLGLRALYKDGQRLATNANLRGFMAQISKETLDASYFYVFPYYTALDGSVDLAADPAPMTQILDAADNDYDKWVAQGDCLVLVTRTSLYRTTDIRQIRIYYRVCTSQTQRNTQVPIRYYETSDWGEGTASTSNGHSDLATALNAINLSATPSISGSRQIADRTIGRLVPSPYTPYASGDRYPAFATESPDSSATNGFVSINLEFVNGTAGTTQLSSSSFNYTISPRR